MSDPYAGATAISKDGVIVLYLRGNEIVKDGSVVGSQRCERHRPGSIFISRCLGRVLCELDGHLFAYVGPSPNPDRLISLKHHVVREDAGQANLGQNVRNICGQ